MNEQKVAPEPAKQADAAPQTPTETPQAVEGLQPAPAVAPEPATNLPAQPVASDAPAVPEAPAIKPAPAKTKPTDGSRMPIVSIGIAVVVAIALAVVAYYAYTKSN